MEINIVYRKSHWKAIMSQLWSKFLPFPLDDNDNLPCSMTPIFCELYPAAYYSHKWSEVMFFMQSSLEFLKIKIVH